MKTKITHKICRKNLGDEVTDAQYAAYKSLVASAIAAEFPGVDVVVGDSDFSNASTTYVDQRGPVSDDDYGISRGDVESVIDSVGDSWCNAE